MQTYLISGCGVSAICDTRAGVEYWISEMVKRGGAPTVLPIGQEGL